MPFKFHNTELPEVLLIERMKYQDNRGYFSETFKKSDFSKNNIGFSFVQDNFSKSRKGVIRGLHYQNDPKEQGKLVTVLSGEIFDVAVDIRPNSENFGKWTGANLSEDNGNLFWIPPGFAHGFQALEDSRVLYKVTEEYSKEHESGILWNDPTIHIEWPMKEHIVSEKDSELPTFLNVFPERGD